jgi:hypothetical protein
VSRSVSRSTPTLTITPSWVSASIGSTPSMAASRMPALVMTVTITVSDTRT